jgi:hypothetical protein
MRIASAARPDTEHVVRRNRAVESFTSLRDKKAAHLAAQPRGEKRFRDGGSGMKRPDALKTPSAASACTCGLKLTRSPKVCTKR